MEGNMQTWFGMKVLSLDPWSKKWQCHPGADEQSHPPKKIPTLRQLDILNKTGISIETQLGIPTIVPQKLA